MIIDELNKKIADIESLANDKTSTIEAKVSDLTDGLLMVADAVDIIPEMVDEKITAITKEFTTIKDTVSKVKAQKGDKGDRGEPGIDGIGIKGDKGEDGSPDTGEQIASKLNELEGVIDTKVLKDFNIPDVSNLQNQINTIGNQTLRLLSRPTSTSTVSTFTGVTTDATLTGVGTVDSPLKVVSTSASDVAVTVRAATTAALAGTWTYNNGTAGVGATLTRTTNGVLPNQDGVSLMDGDRFLIKNQASTLVNGVYVLTQKGVASVSPTIFTRATDADTTAQLDELVVTVSEGSTNRGTVWGQQTNNPVVGTSAITFATVPSTAVTQATAGTQVAGQIPYWTGTARQLSKSEALFKRDPVTKDTLIARTYTNSDDAVVITGFKTISDIGSGHPGTIMSWGDDLGNEVAFAAIDSAFSGDNKGRSLMNAIDEDGNENSILLASIGGNWEMIDTNGNTFNFGGNPTSGEFSVTNADGDVGSVGVFATGSTMAFVPTSGDTYEFSTTVSGARWTSGDNKYKLPTNFPSVGDQVTVESTSGGNRAILKFDSPMDTRIESLAYGTTTSAAADKFHYAFTSSTGATTVNLDATYPIGKQFRFSDVGRISNTSNITIDSQTGNTIISSSGASQQYAIAGNGESVTIQKVSSTQWMVVSRG